MSSLKFSNVFQTISGPADTEVTFGWDVEIVSAMTKKQQIYDFERKKAGLLLVFKCYGFKYFLLFSLKH